MVITGPSRASASPSRTCSARSITKKYPRSPRSPRRASTAGTSSTVIPTGWRSASAASCARGPVRRTRSTWRAATTPRRRATRRVSGTPVYQINYARCIFCGLCIEACPTRSLTMSNEYELARDNREDLIFTKEQLLAPLLPGMEAPPHPMRLGDSEKDYYLGRATNPGTRPARSRRPPEPQHAASGPRPGGRAHDAQIAAGDGGEAVTFWILGPVAVIAALGMVIARNAVHSALWLVLMMLCLGVFYVVQAGAVHRHGADHRLHRRHHDAVPVRADAGRPGRHRLARSRPCAASGGRGGARSRLRRAARLGVSGRPGLAAVGRARGRQQERQRAGASPADLHQYVFAFEITRPADRGRDRRDDPGPHRARPGQEADPAGAPGPVLAGQPPGPKPGPGVYATPTRWRLPAMLPDGSPASLAPA